MPEETPVTASKPEPLPWYSGVRVQGWLANAAGAIAAAGVIIAWLQTNLPTLIVTNTPSPPAPVVNVQPAPAPAKTLDAASIAELTAALEKAMKAGK